jgi:hypothetical protein
LPNSLRISGKFMIDFDIFSLPCPTVNVKFRVQNKVSRGGHHRIGIRRTECGRTGEKG